MNTTRNTGCAGIVANLIIVVGGLLAVAWFVFNYAGLVAMNGSLQNSISTMLKPATMMRDDRPMSCFLSAY